MSREYSHNSELNLELQIVTDIIGLESLHYAYFEDSNTEINLERIKEGQIRYTHTLFHMIPDDVDKILDVGCGIGDNARYLANQGYEVVAISPDQNHAKFFDPDEINPHFINCKIEDLEIDDTFDLVLMSESQNYFSIEDGIRQTLRYLKNGGYLLISGNFAKTPIEIYENLHNEVEYQEIAMTSGFELLERVDITENVLPTVKYARNFINANIKTTLQVMGSYFQRQMPVRAKLGKFILRDQIQEITDILEHYNQFLDEENYSENVNYVRLLYQKTSS